MKSRWSTLFPDAATSIAEYLLDGVATFGSYVEAIETANKAGHYIYILGWMMDVDFPLTGKFNPQFRTNKQGYLTGDKTLLKLLETATKKDVEVRVLAWDNPLYLRKNERAIDALSKLPNTKVFLDGYNFTPDPTKKIIGQYESIFRKLLDKVRPILEARPDLGKDMDVPPAELMKLVEKYLDSKNVGAHHEKILIVKGESDLIAYCGGIDINQNRFASYHDAACRLIGPAAHQILEKFVRRWKYHGEAKSVPLAGANDVKPKQLGPLKGHLVQAKIVGTYNSPDGREKDRSVREAYFKIIAEARNYIYIEDQYLVNIEVAKALNAKVRETFFKLLIFVIQDSRETTDIMIPDRKRGEFFLEVIKGLSEVDKKKVALFMINDDLARTHHRHPGLHSKVLIVDDEIAMIGSTNVNQRSFTLDSETSAILFDHVSYWRDAFAFKLRQSTWAEYILKPSGMSMVTWEEFVRHVYSEEGYSILRSYVMSIPDLDNRLTDIIRPAQIPLTYGVMKIVGDDPAASLKAVSILNSEVARRQIFDLIWEYIIDPKVD